MTTLRMMHVRQARRHNWKLVMLKRLGMAGVLDQLRVLRDDAMRHARNARGIV